MHILLIHQAFAALDEPGGTRHHEIAQYLVSQGHQVTIIASPVSYLTGRSEPGLEKSQETGIKIMRVYTYSALHRSFFHRIFSFLSFMVSSFFAGLRVKDVDVVWGTSPPIFQCLTAWALSKIKRTPFLLEIRDLWPAFAIAVGVLTQPMLIVASEWLERFLYQHADLVVVNSPGDRKIVEEYGHPKIQFNIYSRQGIVQLIRREPWFLTLMLDGKILKGEDFLKGLDEINLEVDPEEIIDEIKMMLKGVDKIPVKERANVIIYCLRTALAMKLYYDEELDQKTLVDELSTRYPEFGYYRDIRREGRLTKTVIKKTMEKVMEDLEHVQKAQEKRS